MPAKHVVLPDGSSIPTGATPVTLVSGSTIHGILGLLNDGSFVLYSGTYPSTLYVQFKTTYDNVVTSDQVLEFLQVVDRQESSNAVGAFYPAQVTGFVGATPHYLNDYMHYRPEDGLGFFGSTFYRPSSYAADGTPWSACDRFEVTWALWAFGGADGATFVYGSGINIAKLSYGVLEEHYTQLPTVGSIAPSGTTVTVPQPTVTWWTSVSPQSSYQAAIVPSGTVDSNGVTVGSAGFDPDLADLTYDGWNSGKVYAASTTSTSMNPLTDGTYRAYVRAWTLSPLTNEVASPWYKGASTFTVNAENVNSPTVTLTNDAATYTVKVVIAPAAPVGGNVTPQFYEVQYLDPVLGWVPANIAEGRTTGNATTQFYDSLKKPGTPVSYRARGRYTRSDTMVAVSPWVTATTTVTDRKEWWLRSLSTPTLNRSMHSTSGLLVRDWQPTRRRPQAVSYGVGSRYPTVVHGVPTAATFDMSVWAMSATAVADLTALLEHDGDLSLASPWGEMWRVQVGEEVSEEPKAVAPRSGETTPTGVVRVVSFTLIEVGA